MNPAALSGRLVPQVYNLIETTSPNSATYPTIALADTISFPAPMWLRALSFAWEGEGDIQPVGFFVIVGLKLPFLTVSNSFQCLISARSFTNGPGLTGQPRLVGVPMGEKAIYIPPRNPVSLYRCNSQDTKWTCLVSLFLLPATG